MQAQRRVARWIAQSRAPQLRLRLLGVLAFVVLGPVSNVVAPVILGMGVDALVASPHPDGLGATFVAYAAAYTLVAVFSTTAPGLRDALFSRVLETSIARASSQALEHALRLPLAFHHGQRLGELSQRIERGVRAIEVLARGALFQVTTTLLELAVALAFMAKRMAPLYSLVALCGASVYLVTVRRSSRRRLAQRRQQNACGANAAGVAIEALSQGEAIQLFGALPYVMTRYDRALGQYVDTTVALNRAASVDNTLQHSVMRATLAVIIVMAGRDVAAGRLGVGEIFTGLMLLKGLFAPLGNLGQSYREMQQAAVDMEQLDALFALEPFVVEPPDARVLGASARGAEIRVDDVSYAHDQRLGDALQRVSFTVQRGQTVALVGASGAGKTTLLRLLVRLLDARAGAISIDGIDVRALSLPSLRAAVAVVPQDVVLFNDTMLANIAVAKPDASYDDVLAAALAAELGELLARLPQGLRAIVGERGFKLSGGERQRVGIARALLVDPRILVLDEATSALDSLTEAQVQATLRRAQVGRTTIVVAHRLSTIVTADQILVLRLGKIAERGTHDELIRMNGEYAALWRRQTGDHPVLLGGAAQAENSVLRA